MLKSALVVCRHTKKRGTPDEFKVVASVNCLGLCPGSYISFERVVWTKAQGTDIIEVPHDRAAMKAVVRELCRKVK